MKRPENPKGFALVEIIIAIGVLAVVSMFVVRLFVLAANTQNRARDLDHACFEAQTAVETYKLYGTLSSQEARALWNVIARPKMSGTGTIYTVFYGKDWAPAEAPQENGFTLVFTVTETPPDDGLGVWEDIRVAVYKNSAYLLEDGGQKEIYTLSAGVYDAGRGLAG